MALKKNVFWSKDKFARIKISLLKSFYGINLDKNISSRICYHKNQNEKIHLMLIKIAKGFCSKIHNHPRTDEFYILWRGSIKIIIFGKKKKFKILSKQGDVFKVPKKLFHQVKCQSFQASFFEIKLGPFPN